MELVAKITLLFAGWGAIAGVLSGSLQGLPTGQGSFLLLAIFLLLFYAAYRLAPNILKFIPDEFPGGRWTGLIALKRGFLGFLIMWLVLWILTYNIAIT